MHAANSLLSGAKALKASAPATNGASKAAPAAPAVQSRVSSGRGLSAQPRTAQVANALVVPDGVDAPRPAVHAEILAEQDACGGESARQGRERRGRTGGTAVRPAWTVAKVGSRGPRRGCLRPRLREIRGAV